MFFIKHKDTKKSIHFQIIAAVSLFTDEVLPFSVGISSINDGDLEMNADKYKINGSVPSGRVLVDGLGVGDVGNIVLRDRKLLAEGGLIVVVVTLDAHTHSILSGPDVVSRGFVYMRESEDLMERIRECARKSIVKCNDKRSCDWNTMKAKIKNDLSDYLYFKTKRKPMILPVIMEV